MEPTDFKVMHSMWAGSLITFSSHFMTGVTVDTYPKAQPHHLGIWLLSTAHIIYMWQWAARSRCTCTSVWVWSLHRPPSGGLSLWDGLRLACGERTAGATPSAALLFLHRLTFDCLYVWHDKDIWVTGPLWQRALLGSLPTRVNLAAGPCMMWLTVLA